MKSKILLLLVMLLSMSNIIYSQNTTDTTNQEKVIIELNDGTQKIGIIISDDGREILLLTSNIGKVYINKSNIKSIRPINNEDIVEEDGLVTTISPFQTRYYFTTNALPVKKKEGYTMIHLYGPEIHYGLTDNFSIGIMTTWIASPFVLAMKYTIPTKNEKLNFGLGSLLGSSGYLFQFRGWGGLQWGMVTLGDKINNITVSLGVSYINTGGINILYRPGVYDYQNGEYPNSYEEKKPTLVAPVIGVGGIVKLSSKLSFIWDSMLFLPKGTIKENNYEHIDNKEIVTIVEQERSGALLYLMPGLRFQNAPDKSFQIALAGVTYWEDGDSFSFPVPTVSWFRTF